MDATTYDRRDEGWEPYDAPQDEQPLPRRPRRQFFNKRSAALVAVVTCAIGFYAGVSIEKGQVSNSGTITLPGTTGTGGAAATGARSGAAGTRAGGSGLAALFGGGGFAGGAAGGSGTSFGTISGVKGNTLYVTASTGNVTKVKLSSATKITKSLGVKPLVVASRRHGRDPRSQELRRHSDGDLGQRSGATADARGGGSAPPGWRQFR